MLEQVREDIRCVFERDPAATSMLVVLLCYPGLHAVWAHRVQHRLWCAGWKTLARVMSQGDALLDRN